jgi:hypothetical protein
VQDCEKYPLVLAGTTPNAGLILFLSASDLFLCVQELPGQGATGYLLYYGKDFTPGDRPELSCDSVDLLV